MDNNDHLFSTCSKAVGEVLKALGRRPVRGSKASPLGSNEVNIGEPRFLLLWDCGDD